MEFEFKYFFINPYTLLQTPEAVMKIMNQYITNKNVPKKGHLCTKNVTPVNYFLRLVVSFVSLEV